MPTWMRPLALWLRLAPWQVMALGQCLPVNPWGVQGLGTCMKNKWVAIDKATKARQLASSIEAGSETIMGSWSVWVFTVSTIPSTWKSSTLSLSLSSFHRRWFYILQPLFCQGLHRVRGQRGWHRAEGAGILEQLRQGENWGAEEAQAGGTHQPHSLQGRLSFGKVPSPEDPKGG